MVHMTTIKKYLRPPSRKTRVLFALFFIPLTLTGVLIAADYYANIPEEAVIKTSEPQNVSSGTVTSSSNTDKSHSNNTALQAETSRHLTYESSVVDVKEQPNAAVLHWKQSGSEGVTIYVRTMNGSSWTQWTEVEPNNTTRDGSQESVDASSLVLASTIDQFQYKVELTGSHSTPSSVVDVSEATLQSIDSKTGPSGEKSILQKILSSTGVSHATGALMGGPSIITRAEWGNPRANNPEWQPDYAPLKDATIHHTATTEPSDSFQTVRAIWQYHTYDVAWSYNGQSLRGWGDIGYNYLVDRDGRIFEGRYSDRETAFRHKVDAIGAHASGHNAGSVGVALIGTYSTITPTQHMIDSASHVIGYKLAHYGVDPRGISGFGYGDAVIGHRQVNPTSCPGDATMSRMGEIKRRAGDYFQTYQQRYLYHQYDYSHTRTEYIRNGEPVSDTTAFSPGDEIILNLHIKNIGIESWHNTGTNAVSLGTDRGTDRASIFYDPGHTPSPNRLGTFTHRINPSTGETVLTSEIKSGETALFILHLRVPQSLTSDYPNDIQSYLEYVRPVREYVAWFPADIGMHVNIKVHKDYYDWQKVSQTIYTDETRSQQAPAVLEPGKRYLFETVIKNTGDTEWGGDLRLGTDGHRDRESILRDVSWEYGTRASLHPVEPLPITPGEYATFRFWGRAPSTAVQQVKESFSPVIEGVTWLPSHDMHWNITTTTGSYDWSLVEQGIFTNETRSQTAPDTLAPGTKYYMYLRAKNTGTIAWDRTNFRLGTDLAHDRQSLFYDPSWIYPTRPAQLTEASVAPGEIGTFGFWIRTPLAGASRVNEYFSPVVEHVRWLEGKDLHWALTSSSGSYDWQPVSQHVFTDTSRTTPAPTTLTPNTRYYLSVSMKNTGHAPWYSDSFRLGADTPRDRVSRFKDTSWPYETRAAILKETSVAPGETGTFEFWITTPSAPGSYTEAFSPLIEYTTWLDNKDLRWPLTVQ